MSSISFVSYFVGFYSQLTRFCFMTHFLILLALLSTHVLSIRVLFTKETPGETGVLGFDGYVLLELVVLVRTCTVHRCWVREYEGLGAKKNCQESMANAARFVEVKAKDLDERMRRKYGQWYDWF
ncbi:hypothetical protein ACJRO7_015957 [Eucalyptus globulus]|uniref:Uncharacterized protein n=1 Tax=Eucalyptus globulus TaxID=34317 RepID=A0ABD3L933_EUCGL